MVIDCAFLLWLLSLRETHSLGQRGVASRTRKQQIVQNKEPHRGCLAGMQCVSLCITVYLDVGKFEALHHGGHRVSRFATVA